MVTPLAPSSTILSPTVHREMSANIDDGLLPVNAPIPRMAAVSILFVTLLVTLVAKKSTHHNINIVSKQQRLRVARRREFLSQRLTCDRPLHNKRRNIIPTIEPCHTETHNIPPERNTAILSTTNAQRTT